MEDLHAGLRSFLEELSHRKVYRVAIAYTVVAIAVVEAADLFLPRLGLPDWTVTLVVVLTVLGFPFALVLAWAFEVTPEGVQRTTRIREDGPSDVTESGRGIARWALIGLGLLAVAVPVGWYMVGGQGGSRPERGEIRSLAVLPLENLAREPEVQEYFADGMTEALISELSHIGALKVISRTSAMRYKGTDKSLPEIAAELGVAGIVEGSVLWAKNRVRITVQLLHGPTDRHLWSESYERDLRDILALQSNVARDVAEQIQVVLAPQEAEHLSRDRVVDPAAYDAYLRGQRHYYQLTPQGWEAATEAFERSIEQDPSYAPAHAMLSLAYSWLGSYSFIPPAVSHSRALAAAERAVALDSSLAEAYASLAMVKTSFGWDWAAADRASRTALQLNPNSRIALVSRAVYLSWVARHDEAIAVAQRAVDMDPVAPWTSTRLGMHYFLARHYDEAIKQLHEVLALEPAYREAHVWLFFSYMKKGMIDQAEAELRWAPRRGWIDAWILAERGRPAEARRTLEQAPAIWTQTAGGAYATAIALGELGDHDRALELLERAYHGRTPLISVLKIDPRLDALRDDPRFQDLLDRMDYPES